MRKNKRLLSVLLSLIMAFGLLPASLITADALVEYDLWVGGKRVTSENAGNIFGDNSARYDHATQTLTLQNPKLTGMYNYALIYSENKLKVVGSLASQSYVTEYGIFVNMGSLEFNKMNSTDNGSLSFNGKRTGVYAGGDITILDKHVYAYGEAGTGIYSKTGNIYIDAQDKQIVANGGAHGLCCSGSVTIADVGALNANASAVEGVGINAMSGSVRIGSGCKGEISASGERAGVWAKKDFVMHGGKIEIVCTRTKEKSRTDYGYGVFCKDGDLTVDGGSFKATGGYAATSAQNFTIKNCTFYTSLAWIGISNFGDLTIEKADVTSKGYAWGVSMSGNLTLNAGSEVFAMCEEDIALKVLGSVTIDPSLAINEPEDGKLVGSKFLNKNDQEAKLVRIGKPIEKYDIWIGADQITELNKNDFFGDGSVALDTTTTPYTLTLNDPAIPGEWADSKIFIDGIDVAIKGKATLEGSEYAINSDSSGSIDLYGDFNLKGKTVGLFCAGNLAIEEGTIVVEGGKDGIYVVSDCVIEEGIDRDLAGEAKGLQAARSPAPAEHQVKIGADPRRAGIPGSRKSVDGKRRQRYGRAAVVPKGHFSLQRGNQPVIIGQRGKVRGCGLHPGGAHPPEKVPLRVNRLGQPDGELGGDAARPAGNGVIGARYDLPGQNHVQSPFSGADDPSCSCRQKAMSRWVAGPRRSPQGPPPRCSRAPAW